MENFGLKMEKLGKKRKQKRIKRQGKKHKISLPSEGKKHVFFPSLTGN